MNRPRSRSSYPDGRILLIANHDAGSLAVIDLERGEVLRTVPAGVGVRRARQHQVGVELGVEPTTYTGQ